MFDPRDEICSKNLCNCGDWLLDFDNGCNVLDPFDLPQDLDANGQTLPNEDEQLDFNKDNCFQVPYAKSNALELAELFSTQRLLTPLWNSTPQKLDEHQKITTTTSDSGASSSGDGHGDPESGLGQTTSAPISSVSGGSGSSSVSSSTSAGKQDECCKQEPETWRCEKTMNGAITDLLKEFDVCFNSNEKLNVSSWKNFCFTLLKSLFSFFRRRQYCLKLHNPAFLRPPYRRQDHQTFNLHPKSLKYSNH